MAGKAYTNECGQTIKVAGAWIKPGEQFTATDEELAGQQDRVKAVKRGPGRPKASEG